MATVKFSQELRQIIKDAAKVKFQKDVDAATATAPKDWGPRIYDALFNKYTALMESLPVEFFLRKDSFTIDQIDGINVGLSFSLNGTKRWPNEFPADFPARKRSSYSDGLVISKLPELDDFKQEVVEWRGRIKAAQSRQTEFVESVDKIIKAYVTLAPALKAWPPLWDLIPEETKEKHKKIVERKVDKVELDVDLDRMTALASLTKLRK